jgi:hypothetical protein
MWVMHTHVAVAGMHGYHHIACLQLKLEFGAPSAECASS